MGGKGAVSIKLTDMRRPRLLWMTSFSRPGEEGAVLHCASEHAYIRSPEDRCDVIRCFNLLFCDCSTGTVS